MDNLIFAIFGLARKVEDQWKPEQGTWDLAEAFVMDVTSMVPKWGFGDITH